MVMPSRVMNSVNSKTWPARKTDPSIAVASSQVRVAPWSPRDRALWASTIVSELIRSTNELTEVKGMS